MTSRKIPESAVENLVSDLEGKANKSEVESSINLLVPTGTIVIWSAPNPPAGYLVCNGAAISRTTYANLFHAIGTTWGAGDGNTTFNLPNFIDRVPQGRGNRGGVGAYLEESLPNHNHNISFEVADNEISSGYIGWEGKGKVFVYNYHTEGANNPVYQNNAPVQQAATVVNFCIKY